jgi:hypothetical protein
MRSAGGMTVMGGKNAYRFLRQEQRGFQGGAKKAGFVVMA